MRFFLLTLTFLAIHRANAEPVCHPIVTDASQMILKSDTLLIATHANEVFDVLKLAKKGIDQTIAFAKAKHIPRVYLTKFEDPDYYQDCKPNYWVKSEQGEFNFSITAHHVISVGGFWEDCENRSMAEVIRQWKNLPAGNLTLTYVLDSLFMNGETISGGIGFPNGKASGPDPYREAFDAYKENLSEKSYQGLPVEASTLQSMMGIIKDPALEIEFVKRNLGILRRNAKGLANSNYRVELHFKNEPIEVIQAGEGAHPPLLKIEYLDSLSLK